MLIALTYQIARNAFSFVTSIDNDLLNSRFLNNFESFLNHF